MVEPICLICRKRGCKKHKNLMNRLKGAVSPISKIKNEFFGSGVTPFVGSYNYPKVNLGLLAPPEINREAWKSDSPEYWYRTKYKIPEIVEKRTSLINPKTTINVKKPLGKLIEVAQEIAFSKRTPDTEFSLKKKPDVSLFFNSYNPPVGSPAKLKKATITENIPVKKVVDKTITDTDLKAVDGVYNLYKGGIETNQIMRVFSTGLLGLKTQRRMVPTKFSITAVDDIISKKLRHNILSYQQLGEFRLFSTTYIGNHYEILFIPETYEYELIEIHLPKNFVRDRNKIRAFSDYENHWGIKGYADKTAGAFYSGRLACMEYLESIKRQGSIIIFREVLPSYFLPLGIWQMREACRGALKNNPETFSSLKDALNAISPRMRISLNHWLRKSKLLTNKKSQRKLTHFLNRRQQK